MSKAKHEVFGWQHISAIAASRGFARFTAIWDAEGNTALREKREDPHQLLAGDRLTVPSVKPPVAYARATGAVHTFVVAVEKLKLRFKVLDLFGKPANVACSVATRGRTEIHPDGEGVIVVPIARDCTAGQLSIGEATYNLAIGALGPIADPSAQAARLQNLGCWYGDDDDLGDADALALATELFQMDHGLEITGRTDDTFIRKLRQVHDGKD